MVGASLIFRAGRLQLVKSVLSTIPTYVMSCFRLPKWLVARIDAIRRRFLWISNNRNHPIHLMNWQRVCLPVRCGGLGVINLHLQNTALLLRWLWRLYEPNRQLWATYALLLHAIQPSHSGPIILAKSGSFFWTSILLLRQLFHSCAKFKIVSGENVSFWHDVWASEILADTIMGRAPRKCISLREAKQLTNLLLPAPLTRYHLEVVQLLQHFTPQHGSDKLLWNLSPSQIFSVNSAYKVLSQGGKLRSATMGIWTTKVTPSMRLFFFLFIHNRILTQEVMLRRGMQCEPRCVMCGTNQVETDMHLFFHCAYAAQVWYVLSHTEEYTILTPKETD